jgi:photosystem II stability/assembly factor-like uncharacterized protein
MQSDRVGMLGLVILAMAAAFAYAIQWEPVDQQPAGGTGYDVSVVTAGSQTYTYVCVAPAGVNDVPRIYVSTNGGSSWDSAYASSGMRAVEAYPTNPPTVYAGGSGMGVRKSTNGGSSWSACQGSPTNVTTIAVAGTTSDVVYVADGRWDVGSKGSVYRTTNGGSTWVDVAPAASDVFVNDIAVNQAHPESVLVGCSADGQAIPKGVYATTNGGANWTHAYSSNGVYSLAIASSNPSVAYAGTSNGQVLKSTDGGQNWTALQWNPPGTVYSIAVDPDDEDHLYASISGSGVWCSSDGGADWSDVSSGILLTSTYHSRIAIGDVDPNILFVGEDHAGFYRTTNAGTNWQQVSTWSPCRDIRKLIADQYEGYYWTYDDNMVVDVSTDGGSDWTSTLVRGAGVHADMVHPTADTLLIAGPYDPNEQDSYAFGIIRSTDRGYSWGAVYGSSEGNADFYQFGVAPSDPERIYGATVIDGDPRILRSDHCGADESWYEPEQTTHYYSYNAVAVSPDDRDLVYFGCRDGQVVKSQDGGFSVTSLGRLSNLHDIEIRRLVLGAGLVMYAATDSGVYKSNNAGLNWTLASTNLTQRNLVDLVMDPNGSALWTTSCGPTVGPHVYVSYDGAASWTLENDNLPSQSSVYSLSFDNDSNYLHAGTSAGVYTLKVHEGKVGPLATYPNWGKKLVRDADNDILHVVYTGDSTVFYKQSTDGGETWSEPEPVGYGMDPAMVLNVGSGALTPWVVYLTPDSSIMRAVRTDPGVWDIASVFTATGTAKAGAPSVAAGVAMAPYLTAYVVYPVYSGYPTRFNYIYFNTITPSVSSPEVVSSAGLTYCYGASVAGNPDAAVHVCWIQGQSVYYSKRTSGTWSAPTQKSSSQPPIVTEPASNPSVEGYGDSLHCVWRGPHSALTGDYTGAIWRRSMLFSPQTWNTPWRVSQAPDSISDFPVMTTYFATVWHQESSTENYDIWGKFGGNTPQRFFQTSLMSRYPHATGYWYTQNGQTRFMCDVVWTEEADPDVHEVRFDTVTHASLLLKGDECEPGTYYAAELGQSEPSPYCLSRGGYARFESWNVDTSASMLRYELPYLDPRGSYQLRAIIYHEGRDSLCANVRCDSGDWVQVRAAPHVPDTVWVQVPKRLYQHSGKIILELARTRGDYVALGELRFFQVESRNRGHDGAQSLAVPGVPRNRLLGCAPNPVNRTATVSYELGQSGPVALTVHDVSGRLVRRLESGNRSPGRHEANWDVTDDHGRNMPAGIYFVRFSAGGQASSCRITLVR